MKFPFNYDDLPLKRSVDRYIETGLPVGDFLTGVLTNDLGKACRHADSRNLPMIPVYWNYLYNRAPTGCYGSKEKHDIWVEHRGLQGKPECAIIDGE